MSVKEAALLHATETSSPQQHGSEPEAEPERLLVRVAAPRTPGWEEALELVQLNYRRSFGANVLPSPDVFVVSYTNPEDGGEPKDLRACSGMSFAERRAKLFSEQYLDGAAEEVLSQTIGEPVRRDEIVEMGSLASAGGSSGAELLKLLPILAWCSGRRFVLGTATTKLSQIFQRLNINWTPLARASRERLSHEERQQWGSYYEREPQTGFIRLDRIEELFRANTGRYVFETLFVQVSLKGKG